jgi:hypothetical protein
MAPTAPFDTLPLVTLDRHWCNCHHGSCDQHFQQCIIIAIVTISLLFDCDLQVQIAIQMAPMVTKGDHHWCPWWCTIYTNSPLSDALSLLVTMYHQWCHCHRRITNGSVVDRQWIAIGCITIGTNDAIGAIVINWSWMYRIGHNGSPLVPTMPSVLLSPIYHW